MIHLSRRTVLGVLSAALVPGVAAGAAETPDVFPRELTLIIAGPEGGGLDGASRRLLGGLASHLPAGTRIGRSTVGGVDGVTGANQFATLAAPDGAAALLVPGAASIAWLVGDSRVHFDPSHWVPVLAGLGPAIVVGRAGEPRPRAGAPLRMAGSAANGATLAGLLAFHLLGARVVPVGGLDSDRAALAALRAGMIDALLLRDSRLLAELPADAEPLFGFGMPDAAGILQRDLLNPAVPTLAEYAAFAGHRVAAGPLYDAWRCAAGAAQLDYALVLPSLTPASAVALWRDAGSHALGRDGAAETTVIYASAAAGLMRALTPNSAALLDLRNWLASKLGWQPS